MVNKKMHDLLHFSLTYEAKGAKSALTYLLIFSVPEFFIRRATPPSPQQSLQT